MRGQFITQHRLQSDSARSLEVKDIPWRNVNGGKATRAILRQIIRTKEQEQEPGRANQRSEREEGKSRGVEKLSRKKKKKKDGKGRNLI